MSQLTAHARSMIAYNHWANGKILEAVAGLRDDALDAVSDKLAHTVGTQMYWYANWTGGEFAEPKGELSLADLRGLFERADANLHDYAAKLTDDEWARTAAWWKRFGFDAETAVGPMLFQVVFHGIHHRAEVAATCTEHGCSPGDLDFLVYLQETAGLA